MGLQHASLWLCCLHAAVSLRPPAAPRVSARRRSLPSAGVFEDDAVGSCTFQLARADGADTVFDKLAERYVLIDPAKGTCCRNFCASCSFHQEDGSFLSEEKFLVEAKVQTYAYRSVEPKTHTALWAKVLFPAKKAKLEQEAFQSMFADVDVTVLDSVWNWLSDGASAVTKSRVIQQFKTACDNDEEGLSLEQFRVRPCQEHAARRRPFSGRTRGGAGAGKGRRRLRGFTAGRTPRPLRF
ncbi:hypothetical protein M885DRAFT_528659 [Pelagophyceae sp. CCMP2097]|nr:hypothetical protein M885DRAFT_528659 [Pelagophyceae sp. CCMP2097]